MSAYTAPSASPFITAGRSKPEFNMALRCSCAQPGSGGRDREHRLRRSKLLRIDDLDVTLQDLGIGRLCAVVLSVDEPGRTVGHDVVVVGRRRERADDLCTVRRPCAF